ncbi:hypothetical protein [Pseudomonas sp. NPDC089396]|uniref:hypothetical protein n=1 Tax=Pseudomonas sp. NPDC089396 TaxID=3364461 RepID=UPI0038345BF8
MTDEQITEQTAETKQLARLRAVTFDELDAFYAEMGTEHPCDNCGSNEWTHIGDGEGPVSLRLPAFNRDTAFALAFAIHCNKCGNMRLTIGSTLLDWLQNKDHQ